jgi:hypothetical protein
MSHAGLASHLDKSFEHAKQEIADDVYHSSLYQPVRRQAIFDSYASLSRETKQKLDVLAERMVLNFKERLVDEDMTKAPILSKDGAIEIIMTLFFTSDWYPENSKKWNVLQEIPGGKVDTSILAERLLS